MFTLDSRRILVTGASSGIGRATAVLAARLGAHVILTGRSAERLDETRRFMPNAELHRAVVGDLADAQFIPELASAAVEGGRIDGFVHAAGTCPVMPVSVADARLIGAAMSVNYTAFLLLMRLLTSPRAANEGFSAVAISSVSADAGWAGGSVYAGTKGALNAAVRSLAVELAPRKMRVNAVLPSCIRTPMLDELQKGKTDAELLSAHPLGFGTPEQVASAACFMLSDASSFITGVGLPVDGGYLAR